MTRSFPLAASDSLLRRCRSWGDFAEAVAPLPEKAKGDAFERLVQLHLRIAPQYRTEFRNVWLYREAPARLRDRLRLPGPDLGIDLIAETRAGLFWAIQAKYRTDPRKALTLRDLSTFATLAYTRCRGIGFALVCTTTERVPKVLEDTARPVGFQTSDVWQGLDREFFPQAHALIGGRPARPVPAKPRSHQRRAIRHAVEHFRGKRERRGKLIMPCGAGKTLTALWIAQELHARTVLLVVTSLALIRQTLNVWLREVLATRRPVSWFVV